MQIKTKGTKFLKNGLMKCSKICELDP